jgi:lipoprotein-anchoring transpeptidase ErfK/SrfK
MVRNESIARIFMFLCFGTAILSLGVHWRMRTIPAQFEQPATAAGSPARAADHHRAEVVMGASAPRQQATQQPASPRSTLTSLARAIRPNSPAGTEVVVNLSDRRTYVYKGGEVIASYPIAIGKEGWETPTGTFRVTNMQPYPIWQHPITGKVFPSGPDSPLGARWIGFWSDGRNEIGFHGTPDIHLLGSAISHGCLRMRNEDVRLLYEQVEVGTLVSVRD